MNQSLNIHSDLHWTSENWELQSGSGCPAVGIEASNRHHQFSSYPGANRSVVEWDWEHQQQMLLAQNVTASAGHSSIDDGERKLQLVTSPASMKPYPGLMQPSNYGSFPPQGQLNMFGSSHHGNASSNLQGFGVQLENAAMTTPAAIPFASVGGGVVSVNSSFGDLRSFEQRRRLFGLLEMDPRNYEAVKREELFAEANARIGLNLGVRTYFSTEDTLSRLGKRPRANSPGVPVPLCQAEGCKADLSAAKHYHRRHKVCELHSKAATVIANGQTQRFCQQCSRFHPLGEFDEGKRSCRKRLADHNRRRRKPQPTASSAAAANKENETDASQEVAPTGEEKPAGSPTSSQEHSDSKTGSGDSLQLRASCTSPATNKSEDSNSGAHSTLLGDQPAAPDTQALLPALSPSVSLLQNQNHKSTEKSSSYERLAKGANLTLASSSGSTGGNGIDNHQSMASWLKPLELSSPSAQQKPQLLGFTESRSGQSTPMSVASSCSSSPQVASSPNLVPVQSSSCSRAPSAAAEWIFSNVGSGKRTSYDTNMGTFHGEIDGQQIFGLLDNPLTMAAQQEQQQQEDPNLMGHLVQS